MLELFHSPLESTKVSLQKALHCIIAQVEMTWDLDLLSLSRLIVIFYFLLPSLYNHVLNSLHSYFWVRLTPSTNRFEGPLSDSDRPLS